MCIYIKTKQFTVISHGKLNSCLYKQTFNPLALEMDI